jgi:hypothetical protein
MGAAVWFNSAFYLLGVVRLNEHIVRSIKYCFFLALQGLKPSLEKSDSWIRLGKKACV